MPRLSNLVEPRFTPPLEPDFRPAALANRAFREESANIGVSLVIGLERNNGEVSRYETTVFPESHPRAQDDLYYVERIVKFLLWQRGGYKFFIGGPRFIGEHIRKIYAPDGERKFDFHFMGEQVYEQIFTVIPCSPSEVPSAHETGKELGRHLDGCRIGFDLGASDRKVSAVVDGQAIFSEEVVWEPRKHADPEYHFQEIMAALKTAASKMPRVDAIGGSSAGIYIDNRPMVASLFRTIPPERFSEIKNLFLRIQNEYKVPLEVINDGDVTALAGAMSLEDNGILGVALGSSEATGYVDVNGRIMGWLNELAFAPIDYSPTAPADEWSGDIGVGSQYFSQQCVFRLADRAGIQIPVDITDAEKLKFVQEKLEAGHAGAMQIWQSMGIYLGYGLAHYADFYDIKHVLILGRCTSGRGGDLLLEGANQVLKAEFPELASRIHVQLPDEKSRRVGQSIAAASLPALPKRQERIMKFHLPTAEIFIPDGLPIEQALERTTHIAIAAHQDDIEIMAAGPILECFQQNGTWFTGVVVTDGRGSPRDDLYKDYTDEEMHTVRFKEQKKAAVVGEYAAQVFLDYPSKTIKDASQPDPATDLVTLLKSTRPQIVYTHNPADKHDTHVAVALRTIAAIRSLPEAERPKKLYGCEVWRDLDWMLESDKVQFDLTKHENLQTALLGVFDSQIAGGKRYDLASMGRRRANATYAESHGVDQTLGLSYGMDLTPLIADPKIDVAEFVQDLIQRFSEDVKGRLARVG